MYFQCPIDTKYFLSRKTVRTVELLGSWEYLLARVGLTGCLRDAALKGGEICTDSSYLMPRVMKPANRVGASSKLYLLPNAY